MSDENTVNEADDQAENTNGGEGLPPEAESEDEALEAVSQDDDAVEDADEADADDDADADEDGVEARNVVRFPGNATDHAQLMRMVEALLFAAAEPLDIDSIASRLPEGADVGAVIEDLQKLYETRGVHLVRVANKWMFRTADDLAFLMEREAVEQKKLSRAAMETLAIIAYHQPVTRAEIEEVRGVSVSKGTLDV